MKWISFFVASLLEISIICCIPFMRNATAIILFLSVLLFIGLIIQQSTEDMPPRPQKVVSGFMLGTYATATILSFLLYKRYLLL